MNHALRELWVCALMTVVVGLTAAYCESTLGFSAMGVRASVAAAVAVVVFLVCYPVNVQASPLITLGLAANGKLGTKESVVNFHAQLAGGFVGTIMLEAIFSLGIVSGAVPCLPPPVWGDFGSDWWLVQFAMELIFTTISIDIGMNAGAILRHWGLDAKHEPALVSVALFALILATGATMNPWAYLAPSITSSIGSLHGLVIMVVGPCIGTLIAAAATPDDKASTEQLE